MLSRRSFLSLASLLLARCKAFVMPKNDPFLMWGNTQTIRAEGGVAGLGATTGSQLTKVTHDRPDTWSFWMGAEVLGGSLTAPGGGTIIVIFDLTSVGVGRSFFNTKPTAETTLTGFCFFRFNIPGAVVPIGAKKWTTAVPAPVLDEVPSPAATPPFIEWIPANEINVQARVMLTGFDPGDHVELSVSAFFAPRTHVRNSWFEQSTTLLSTIARRVGG